MKKPKTKAIISGQTQALESDVEQIQSLLAPTVLTCLNTYGKYATKRALEWLIVCVNNSQKNEDEDEST